MRFRVEGREGTTGRVAHLAIRTMTDAHARVIGRCEVDLVADLPAEAAASVNRHIGAYWH